MGDLNAQIKAQGTLKERLLAQVEALAIDCEITGGLVGVSAYFRNWLGGVPVGEISDDRLGALVGMLERRKAQLKPAPVVIESDPDFDPSQPFG